MTEEKQNNKKKEQQSIEEQIKQVKKEANEKIKRLQRRKIKKDMLKYKDRLDSISLLTNYDLSTCDDKDFGKGLAYLERCVDRYKKQGQKGQQNKQKTQQK